MAVGAYTTAKLLGESGDRAAAGRRARWCATRRGRDRRACWRAPPRRGCAGPYLAGRDARAGRRAARARAALPDVPRRLERADGVPADAAAGARGDVPARALAGVHRLPGGAAGLRRAGQPGAQPARARLPGRARRRGRRASWPGCTSRARRCWRSSSARRAPGLAGGLLVVVTSLAAPGAFPLALSVALLTGVDPRRARQPGRRGAGARRAGADPDLGGRRQQGARRCRTTCRRTSRSPSTGSC